MKLSDIEIGTIVNFLMKEVMSWTLVQLILMLLPIKV